MDIPILRRLSEGLEEIRLYVSAIFYPAAVAILLPNIFPLEFIKLLANIIASVPHECGHFIFNIIGLFSGFLGVYLHAFGAFNFLATLAGSLGYTLTPLALSLYYTLKKDRITAGAYLAFLSISLDHMAWYCSDALKQSGPVFDSAQVSVHHDWYFMLTYLGILKHATEISSLFHIIAYIVALVAITYAVLELTRAGWGRLPILKQPKRR